MFSINNRKQINKKSVAPTKSSIITSPIPPSDNLAKLTTSFEEIVQSPPPPYDSKSQPITTKKIPPPSSISSTSSESDPATKITRTTTTTTVTTVTTTTISAKNSPGQGPLYLDFGDFSLSPIGPEKLGSGDDSAVPQKPTGPLVTFDNNISVNDPSSITIVSSKTSTDPVKVQQFEEIPPNSTTSTTSNTSTSKTTPLETQRSFPSLRPELKGYQKLPIHDNSGKHHYLKRIESAPVMPMLSDDIFDSGTFLSAKSLSNLSNSNNSDSKNITTQLENKTNSETPKQYLERMQYTLSKSKLATMLAKNYKKNFFFFYLSIKKFFFN
jgi:hypothetical protein